MGIKHYPRYELMSAFIDHVKDHPYDSGDVNWTMTRNYAEALQVAHDGWTERRPQVDAVRSEIMGKITEVIDLEFVPTLDVCGSAIDMGEYMTGVPECMISFPMEERDTTERVVRIILDPGGHADISAEQLANRAAAIAALLEVLQLTGRSLEIWVASPVTAGRYSEHSPVVCAHKAGTEVDINAMMFFCGHPSFLRRLIFSHRSMDGIGGGMGSTVPISQELADSVGADVIVQRPRNRTDMTEPDAMSHPTEWVVWQCKQLGLA